MVMMSGTKQLMKLRARFVRKYSVENEAMGSEYAALHAIEALGKWRGP